MMVNGDWRGKSLVGTRPVCGPEDVHPVSGLTVHDMPGCDEVMRGMTFFLHRRGLWEPRDQEEGEDEDEEEE